MTSARHRRREIRAVILSTMPSARSIDDDMQVLPTVETSFSKKLRRAIVRVGQKSHEAEWIPLPARISCPGNPVCAHGQCQLERSADMALRGTYRAFLHGVMASAPFPVCPSAEEMMYSALDEVRRVFRPTGVT